MNEAINRLSRDHVLVHQMLALMKQGRFGLAGHADTEIDALSWCVEAQCVRLAELTAALVKETRERTVPGSPFDGHTLVIGADTTVGIPEGVYDLTKLLATIETARIPTASAGGGERGAGWKEQREREMAFWFGGPTPGGAEALSRATARVHLNRMRAWLNRAESEMAKADAAMKDVAACARATEGRKEPGPAAPATTPPDDFVTTDSTSEPHQPKQPKIANRCPSCGSQSLFVGAGGWLTCSRLDCRSPGVVTDVLREACRRGSTTTEKPPNELSQPGPLADSAWPFVMDVARSGAGGDSDVKRAAGWLQRYRDELDRLGVEPPREVAAYTRAAVTTASPSSAGATAESGSPASDVGSSPAAESREHPRAAADRTSPPDRPTP